MEQKKYFYAAVVDDCQYNEVSTVRYKNFVDYMIHEWGVDEMVEQLDHYIDDDAEEIDYQEFFEEYYGYPIYYFAMDEDGNGLDNIGSNNNTLNLFCKEHNLIPY